MARSRKKNVTVSHVVAPEEPKTQWQKAIAHIEENLKIYVVALLFLIICAAIGALISVNRIVKQTEAATAYAEAVLEEDAASRLEKLQALKGNAGKWNAELLYMLGETAIEAGKLDIAREAFESLFREYSTSPYVLQAQEAIAFLTRSEGKLAEALQLYESLVEKWPSEYVARRSHVIIGQLYEESGQLENAIAAYRKQTVVFPESQAASKAEQALEKLKGEHPELFQEGEGTPPTSNEIGISAEGETDQTGFLAVEPVSEASTDTSPTTQIEGEQ